MLQVWKISKLRNWPSKPSPSKIEVPQFATEGTNEVSNRNSTEIIETEVQILRKEGLNILPFSFRAPCWWRSRAYTWRVLFLQKTPIHSQQSLLLSSLPQEDRMPCSSTRLCLKVRSASLSSSIFLAPTVTTVTKSQKIKLLVEAKGATWIAL